MLGKTVNLTRYAVEPALIDWESVEDGAFDRLPPPTRKPRKILRAGWCHPSNPLLRVDSAACRHEPWWFLGLRIDTWAAPAGALRHQLDLRKRDWMEETGRQRVPKVVVTELRDNLYVELTQPRTKLIPVALNVGTGAVYVGSTSQDAQVAVAQVWGRTVSGPLERHVSEHLGSPRFLLWLWYRVEHGRVEVSSGSLRWEIWVDEHMEFEGGGTTSKVASGSSAGTSRPSYASLTAGLLPVKVRLGSSAEGRERSVLLGRPPEQVRSLRFAAPGADVAEQLFAVEESLALLDQLDAQYAAIASDDDALSELEADLDRWKAEWNRTLAPDPENAP